MCPLFKTSISRKIKFRQVSYREDQKRDRCIGKQRNEGMKGGRKGERKGGKEGETEGRR